MQRPGEFSHDVVVVGGCGHVGLPLAIALADRGAMVLIYDVSEAAVTLVNHAVMPFDEPGADDKLKAAVTSGALRATTDPASVATAENVVMVIGTPVDEHLNPDPGAHSPSDGACSGSPGRPVARPAQHRVPRSDRAGRGVLAQRGICGRRGVLPRTDRRGQRDDGTLRRCRRSSPPRDEAGHARAEALFGRLTDQVGPMEPRRRSSRSSSPTPGDTSSSPPSTSST